MKTIALDAETVGKALSERKPASLTKLWQALGGKGSVGGATAKKLREIVPGLMERLSANKAVETSKSEAPPKPKVTISTSGKSEPKAKIRMSGKSKWPRSPSNPFREGGYGTAYDILAAHPEGLPKDEWAKLYQRATGKDAQHSRYDLQVLLSACDSVTSERHRSCRDGFFIEREGDFVRLRT